MLRWGTVGLVALLGALLAADALATPVLWTVSGNFDDGGRIDGTFVYDADFDVYSEISLKTTAGSRDSLFFGAMYAGVDADASDAGALLANAATTLLQLAFAPMLSNVGGPVILSSGSETLTSGADEGEVRLLTSGRATGVLHPVPEPSTATLLALGLTGLAARRRFRA
jgi:hypothetical protein